MSFAKGCNFFQQALKFRIECTCTSGKWVVKITCPNVPSTCLKHIKSMQLMWKSEMCCCSSEKSCRYSTCSTVIFTHLRQSHEWNFEPCSGLNMLIHCGVIKSYGNIDLGQHSGNGLLPNGTKPLLEQKLINHQQGLVAFIGGQFHMKYPR